MIGIRGVQIQRIPPASRTPTPRTSILVRNLELFADKAYTDRGWKAHPAAQGIALHTPVKLKKGQTYLASRDSYYSSAAAQAGQGIESFFNRIHERTHIQSQFCSGLILFLSYFVR